MTEPLVRVTGVSRTFLVGDERVHALSSVSMEAHPGEFTAIVGRSGSGKTTLLNIIGGLDRPDEGQVFLGETELSRLSENDLTVLRRTKIGFVFQSFGLLPLLSAYENIELALRIAGAGPRHRAQRTAEMLDMVGLGRRAKHRPYELSGGEQQRVAVARALANQPVLLVADEPTGELDSHTAAEIFALLQRIAREQGTCIVASTHDLAIREAADRTTTLEDGRIAAAQAVPVAALVAPAVPPMSSIAEEAPTAADEPEAEAPAPVSPPTDPERESTAEPEPDDLSRWARPSSP